VEQKISDSSFTRVVYLQDHTLAFKLENIGNVEKPVLSYTFYSENEMKNI
jgi:hypothetical protein